ncbi:hypothetical protein D3H65_04495 [Paraflavitalea soli]|uniref:T9SS C-terminal target domain-containing protein n=1 Tax=Paraflavitalea soli TaxID=2315862 RepID=A0A3B7MRY0_9BACT|nr:choice-of-anchor J domain-containing protein [Paraflavitalea soli]AXY73281.1 hypothetical protein D3H65_04495 [Paraflavitalea soli]
MKRIGILVMLCLWMAAASAQVIFREDFDGVPGTTFGGAGTYAFPFGWFLCNADNNQPDGQVAYVNNGWTRREDFKFNVADSCAFSTSFYAPAGTANDFMWTPLIGPLPDNCQLSWKAIAYDAAYADGYEVRIMTVRPTGGPGDIGNQLTQSSVLFSTTGENNTWTIHTVDLSAYQGQAVYIGFRNNSVDKFLLAIDNVQLERAAKYDPGLLQVTTFEYAAYPLQQVPDFPIEGVIRNEGVLPITNVRLKAEVYNSAQTLVYAQTSAPIASINPYLSANFTLPAWKPAATGQYKIRYFPVIAEAESFTGNDTLVNVVNVYDSVYARDDNDVVGSIGIGIGNGYVGQSFTIQSTTDLRSVSVSYWRGYTGKKYALTIWNMSAGKPNVLIGSTDTLLYPDDNALTDTLPIHGGKLTLTPGEYVIAAVEFDSTLALVQTRGIYTPGKLWIHWNAQPWATIETFGINAFLHPVYIRPNVSNASLLPVKLVSFTGRQTSAGNQLEWLVADQQGILSYEVERSTNGINFLSVGVIPANDLLSFTYRHTDPAASPGVNYYRLKIVEHNKISYSPIIRLTVNRHAVVTLSPNPVHYTAMLQSSDQQLLNTTAYLTDMQGKVIRQMKLTRLPFPINMAPLPAGGYLLRLGNNQVLKLWKQ